MSPSCLAIDFGATATAAAISGQGGEQLIEIDGAPRMPSIICWKLPTDGGAGRLLLGEAAENEAALAPHRVERCPKRKLGQEFMLLGEARIRVTDAVAQIFLQVIAEASALEGGRAPAQLRLTHPAQWGQRKLAKLQEAASIAGFAAAELLPEPVGAAVYFAGEALRAGQHVAVYDLGGGTFDTAVLLRTASGFDVVGRPGGRDDLGGEDFDDRLYQFLAGQLDPDERRTLTSPDADLRWQRAHYDFRKEVRRAKERLSKYVDATVRSPIPGAPDLRVSRAEFESLIREDVVGTLDELERTIELSGQSAETLAAIYLAGGSSRIPLVANLIERRFGRAPAVLGDPKAAIALGAVRAHGQRGTKRDEPAEAPIPTPPAAPNQLPRPVNEAPLEQVVVRAARTPRRPEPARPRNTTAATATGAIAGGGLLAAVASGLLLVDATKSSAPSGIRIAIGLSLVGWLLVTAGLGIACTSFLGFMRERQAGLKAAALVLTAGFSVAFLSETISAIVYGAHGARGTFVAGHAAFGLYDLLAATGAALTAVALERGVRVHLRGTSGVLSWACSVGGAGLLLFAAGSILYLVAYTTGATSAAVSGGIGAQIGGKLPRGGRRADRRDGVSRRRRALGGVRESACGRRRHRRSRLRHRRTGQRHAGCGCRCQRA